jgi:alpha-tubulin suppressor-like RCC1 family protein/fibronectin type 3 domain-containing protein
MRYLMKCFISLMILVSVFTAVKVEVSALTEDPVPVESGVRFTNDNGSVYMIDENNDLWTWGQNSSGQLGDGTVITRYSPRKIMANVAKVAANSGSVMALTTSGDLWVWGENYAGQLGDGTTIDQLSPYKLFGGVIDVAVGSEHAAIVLADHTLWTVGRNSYGQLGNGTNTAFTIFVKVMENVSKVFAESNNTFAITLENDLYAWGNNRGYTLGVDAAISEANTPQYVMPNVKHLDMGTSVIVLTTDQSVYAWGENWYGEVGVGNKDDQLLPVKVLDHAVKVEAGSYSSYALSADGTLYSWGTLKIYDIPQTSLVPKVIRKNVLSFTADSFLVFQDLDGSIWISGDYENTSTYALGNNLGFGVDPGAFSNTIVSMQGTFRYSYYQLYSAGEFYLTSGHELYVSGPNTFSQLGIGEVTSTNAPVKILDDVVSHSTGSVSSHFAVKSDGSLFAWGANAYGSLGTGDTVTRKTPTYIMGNVEKVDSDGIATYIITTDHVLKGWGSNSSYRLGTTTISESLTPVTILSNIVDFQIGWENVMALDASGNLYTWGDNSTGQLGSGSADSYRATPTIVLTNVASFANANGTTMAIKTDGTLWAWGNNYTKQIGDGYQSPVYTPVMIGSNMKSVFLTYNYTGVSVFAITLTNTLLAWGENSSGQLGIGTTTNTGVQTPVLENVRSVDSMGFRSLAVTTSNELYAWGYNSDNNLGYDLPSYQYLTTPQFITSNVESAYFSWTSLYYKSNGLMYDINNRFATNITPMAIFDRDGNYLYASNVTDTQKWTNSFSVMSRDTEGVLLSWGSVSGATSYEISRSTSLSGTYSVIANTSELSFTDLDIANSVTWFYKVRAQVSGTFGAYTDAKKAYIHNRVQDAPEGIRLLQKSNTEAQISWLPNLLLDGYDVYFFESGTPRTLLTTTTTPLIDVNVTLGEYYYVEVVGYVMINGEKVYTQVGEMDAKKIINLSTLPQPEIYTAQQSDALSIYLSWSDESGLDGYKLYRSTNGGEYELVQESANSYYYDYDVVIDDSYVYRIDAYVLTTFGKVYSQPVTTEAVAFVDGSAFVAPTNFEGHYQYSSVRLTWDYDWRYEMIDVYRRASGEIEFTLVDQFYYARDYYNDYDVVEYINYEYFIRVYKSDYDLGQLVSLDSEIITVKTVDLDVPFFTVTANSFSVDLYASIYYENLVQIAFYRSSSLNGDYELIHLYELIEEDWGYSYTDENLNLNTTYFYKVRGIYLINGILMESSLSEPLSDTTNLDVEYVYANPNGSTNELWWSSINDATGYQVYASTNGVDYAQIYDGEYNSYDHAGLSLGTEVYYKVRVYVTLDGVNQYGAFSEPIQQRALPPEAYSNATFNSKSSVTVSWFTRDNPDIDGFYLYMSYTEEDGFVLVGTYASTVTEVTLTTIDPARIPYFIVLSFMDEGGVQYLSPSDYSTKPDVMQPVLVLDSASGTSISFSWEAIPDVAMYYVYAYNEVDGWQKVVETQNTFYTDTTVIEGAFYAYSVIARYDYDNENSVFSSFSEDLEVIAETPRVTNLNAESLSTTSLGLSWDAYPNASGYEVYRSNAYDGVYTLIATITTTNYTNTSLTLGQDYYYKVRAYVMVEGVKQYSGYSNIASAYPTLSAPTNLTATPASLTSIKVSWNAVTGASGYSLFYTGLYDSDWYYITDVTGTSYTHTNLVTGEYYFYMVVAFKTLADDVIYSDFTDYVYSKPTLIAPTNLTVTSLTYDSARVSFNPVSGASGYFVYIKGENDSTYTRVYDGTLTTITLNDLTPGIEYNVAVLSYFYYNSELVTGLATEQLFRTTLSAPVVSGKMLTLNSAQLTWNAVPGASLYHVYKKNNATQNFELVISTADLTYTMNELVTGSVNTFKVVACGEFEGVPVCSQDSNVFSLTSALSIPTGLNISSIDYNAIELSFTASDGVSGYEIYRATSSTGTYTKIATITAVTYTNSGLSFNTSYFYKIRSYVTIDGVTTYSGYTTVISGKTALKAVSNPAAQSSDYASIQVNWSAVSGASWL